MNRLLSIGCIRGLVLLLVWGWLTGFTLEAHGQPSSIRYATALDDPEVQRLGEAGLDLLYNMKFEAAERQFDAIERKYPDNPVGPFLKGLIVWWKILPDLADESHDQAFFDAMEEVVRRSDRLLSRNPNHFDGIFFKGAALGFRGRHRSNRGIWFKAAMDGRGALKYVFDIAAHDTTNADYLFGLGVYHYFADMVPKKYPVVRPLMAFFPDGNREEGLRELEKVAREGRFIRTEAVYFLLQIFMIYEPNFTKSLSYVRWLRQEHPDNPYFHTLEGRVYATWGRWQQADPIHEMVLSRHQAGMAGYNASLAENALYYLARGRMVYRRYDEALSYLLQLEALTTGGREGSYFRIMGRLRQGMVYDALGARTVAVARYREVLNMKDRGGAHDRARRYLEKPYQG